MSAACGAQAGQGMLMCCAVLCHAPHDGEGAGAGQQAWHSLAAGSPAEPRLVEPEQRSTPQTPDALRSTGCTHRR